MTFVAAHELPSTNFCLTFVDFCPTMVRCPAIYNHAIMRPMFSHPASYVLPSYVLCSAILHLVILLSYLFHPTSVWLRSDLRLTSVWPPTDVRLSPVIPDDTPYSSNWMLCSNLVANALYCYKTLGMGQHHVFEWWEHYHSTKTHVSATK